MRDFTDYCFGEEPPERWWTQRPRPVVASTEQVWTYEPIGIRPLHRFGGEEQDTHD